MKYLLVIDMQNDFITGSLGTKEAEQIVDGVCKKIEACKKEGYHILATRDTHFENEDSEESRRYFSTQEGKKLPVLHCVKGTKGWEIEEHVQDKLGDARIFDKFTFGSEELVADMKEKKPDAIELVGLCTDICVVSNAIMLKAALPEIPIRVYKNCCAGVTPNSHEAALMTMSMCQIELMEE